MAIQTAIQDIPDRDIALLRVTGEMDFDVRPAFQKALLDLLAMPRAKLIVDLSRISRMSSVFIGTLIDSGNTATKSHKTLSVMLVEKLATVCRDSGLDKVVSIIVAKAQ